MKHHDDINLLFEDVRINIERLDGAYEAARINDEIEEVLKPVIKSSLEQLRSILEYSAQDIWSSYTKKKNSPYFPYGRDEAEFTKSAAKNLPGLQLQRPNVYALIESIQPHICGDKWLPELCSVTNFNKHRGLSKQVRANSKSSDVVVGGGAIVMRNAGSNSFSGFINGVPIGNGGLVTISNAMTAKQLRQQLGQVPFVKEFEWVEFVFDGSAKDARKLIASSMEMIERYINELRKNI